MSTDSSPPALRRPFPIGWRGGALLGIALAGVVSWLFLELSVAGLVPTGGGLDVVTSFFARAVSPALDYETSPPEGTAPLLMKAMEAARKTVIFAAAAMTLALVIGLLLALPASTAWWESEQAAPRGSFRRAIRATLAPIVTAVARTGGALLRSVHELLWAVLFLAAFGFNTFSAVLALAIPYGGTLAKVFSEMIDEAPRDSAEALRGMGATPAQVFYFGLLPRAIPDMCSYAFYRFECAVRSSALLGFFGYETLGYYIKISFDNLQFGEAWTYLYTLFAIVVVLDVWSGALRRRFVAHE